MKFKTSAKCGGCVAAIRKSLSDLAPEDKWEFDLTEKTMTYTGDAAIDPTEVEKRVKAIGHNCERV